jgi:hypothetical protein
MCTVATDFRFFGGFGPVASDRRFSKPGRYAYNVRDTDVPRQNYEVWRDMMKKFTIAAAATLALASAAPAIADQKTSDDPFVSTQGSLALGAGGAAAAAAVGIAIIAVAAGGDT